MLNTIIKTSCKGGSRLASVVEEDGSNEDGDSLCGRGSLEDGHGPLKSAYARTKGRFGERGESKK